MCCQLCMPLYYTTRCIIRSTMNEDSFSSHRLYELPERTNSHDCDDLNCDFFLAIINNEMTIAPLSPHPLSGPSCAPATVSITNVLPPTRYRKRASTLSQVNTRYRIGSLSSFVFGLSSPPTALRDIVIPMNIRDPKIVDTQKRSFPS